MSIISPAARACGGITNTLELNKYWVQHEKTHRKEQGRYLMVVWTCLPQMGSKLCVNHKTDWMTARGKLLKEIFTLLSFLTVHSTEGNFCYHLLILMLHVLRYLAIRNIQWKWSQEHQKKSSLNIRDGYRVPKWNRFQITKNRGFDKNLNKVFYLRFFLPYWNLN